MNLTETLDPAAQERVLRGWLLRAREQGDPDVFLAKRHSPRYEYRMPVEVLVEDADPPEPICAQTYTISGGGASITCHAEIPVSTRVRICEWPASENSAWIPARVIRCEPSLRGYMIGIKWDHPLPEEPHRPADEADAPDEAESVDAPEAQEDASPEDTDSPAQRRRRRALIALAALTIVFLVRWLLA